LVLWTGAILADSDGLRARIDWGHRLELGLSSSGIVREVLVAPGDRVDHGDVLLRLDQKGFRAAVDRSEASLREATQQLEEARRERTRTRELYERTLLSDHEKTLSEIAVTESEAKRDRVLAALTQARLDLEYSELRAPFAGVVVAVMAGPGQAVANRCEVMPLVAVADDHRWRAVALVTAKRAEGVLPGQPAEVSVRGRALPGKVAWIGLEPAGRLGDEPAYEMVIALEDSGNARLRAGENAKVVLNER